MIRRLKRTEAGLHPPITFIDWVYRNRTRWWLWGLFAVVSAILFFAQLYLVPQFDSGLLQYMGPWTAIIIFTSSPFALLVWAVRDRNKAEEFRIGVSDHAHQVFQKLQEWTNSNNATLQSAAINQLRPFIFGESDGLIPKELAGPNNPFMRPGMEILRALLDDRRWLEEWQTRFEAGRDDKGSAARPARNPRSPVLRAIESILRDENLPYKDFGDWNLSELYLRNAHMEYVNFTNANLEKTDFTEAHLVGAVFVGAQMKDAVFNDAHLESANLSHSSKEYLPYHITNLENVSFVNAHMADVNLQWSNLKDCKLMFTNLEGADLSHAELDGADFFKANLENVNFKGAHLANAKIDKEWQGIFDWIALEIDGQPDIV